MNEITLFKNKQLGEIRTLNIGGEPWFVGNDIAEILGYSEKAKAVRTHVDEDDKGVSVLDTPGGKQNTIIINESGLYSLILSSKLPCAKDFKHWLTSEVIPSIRKHGAYLTPETIHKTLSDPRELAKLLNALADEQDKNTKLEVENAFLTVKAKYYDEILNSKNSVPVTQIAKDYGMSAVTFNKMLHDLKIQYPLGKAWVLFQSYANLGYTQSKTYTVSEKRAVMHTYWTQKGRIFLYDFLKERGIMPLSEQEGYDETLV